MLTVLPGQQFTAAFVCSDLLHHKTTSMLLFADVVNHKIHLSAFMWETELATTGCPNNRQKCWSRVHSSWGKHYSNHCAAQVTELEHKAHIITPYFSFHSFVAQKSYDKPKQVVKTPKIPTKFREKERDIQDQRSCRCSSCFFLFKPGSSLKIATIMTPLFPFHILSWGQIQLLNLLLNFLVVEHFPLFLYFTLDEHDL